MYKTGKAERKAKPVPATQPPALQTTAPQATTPQPKTSQRNPFAGLPDDILALIKAKLPLEAQVSLGSVDQALYDKPDMIQRSLTKEVELISRSAQAERAKGFKAALAKLDAKASKLDPAVASNLYMKLAGKLALLSLSERALCLGDTLQSASKCLSAEWQVIVLLALKPEVDSIDYHNLCAKNLKRWEEACDKLPPEQKEWLALAHEAEQVAREKNPEEAQAQCLQLLAKISKFDVIKQALPLLVVLPRLGGLACRSNISADVLHLIQAQSGAAAGNLALALAQSLATHAVRESDMQTKKMLFGFLLSQAEQLPAEFSASILESLISIATLAKINPVFPDALSQIVQLCFARQLTDEALLGNLLQRAERKPKLLKPEHVKGLLELYTRKGLNHRDPSMLASILQLVAKLPAEHGVSFLPAFSVVTNQILSDKRCSDRLLSLTDEACQEGHFGPVISFVQNMLANASSENKAVAHHSAARILGSLARSLNHWGGDESGFATELLELSTRLSSTEVGTLLQELLLLAWTTSERELSEQVITKCFGLAGEAQVKLFGFVIKESLHTSKTGLLEDLIKRRKLLGPEVVESMLIAVAEQFQRMPFEAYQPMIRACGNLSERTQSTVLKHLASHAWSVHSPVPDVKHAPKTFTMILKAASKLSDKAALREVLKPLAEKVSGLPQTGRKKIMKTLLALAASVSKQCEQEMLRTIKES